MKLRSPILVALGHVDHGKTTLVDTIRGSAIAKTEPGLITQYISASYIPNNTIRERCGEMLSTLGIDLSIPGILWIDSPGHEAFTTLRKRGGAIADFAVLVVDINEGFQPQTKESINFLKQFKTPFCVALTKIDRLIGWNPQEGTSFLQAFNEQSARTQEAFEEKFYRVVGELGQEGFAAERFDRMEDYTKQIAVVPLSGITGEGIPDLLVVLAGIAQRFLKEGLELTKGAGKGTVMEVKEFPGLGPSIDVILYDGEIKKGDHLAIGGKEVAVSRVKALLRPAPLKELRVEKGFESIQGVVAAAGVKIAAPGIENVVAGSPLRAVRNEKDLEKAKEEVTEEVEEVTFDSVSDGVLLRADTLGSLEALIKTIESIAPIRNAHVGGVTKADVMEAKNLDKPIFAFGLKLGGDVEKMARDNQVAVFASDIIYRMIEEYQEWTSQAQEREEARLLENTPHPAQVKVLPGFLFRQKKPAVFGVEVLAGTVKSGSRLTNRGKEIGEVKEIQDQGESKKQAEKGDKVAISMPDVVFGKHVNEGDELEVFLTDNQRQLLERVRHKLRQDEQELLF